MIESILLISIIIPLIIRCRRAATDDHDRYIIKSTSEIDITTTSSLTSSNGKSDKPYSVEKTLEKYLPSLFESDLIGSLELTNIGKGEIEINLSDELSLLICLDAIKEDKENEGGEVASRVVMKSNEENNAHSNDGISRGIDENSMNIDENSRHDSDTSMPWLSQLFYRGLLKAQLMLMERWACSLSAAKMEEEEEKEKEREIAEKATAALLLKKNNNTNNMSSRINQIIVKTEIGTEIPKSSDVEQVSVPTEHSSESHSKIVKGMNFHRTLVHSSLRSSVRDVGDGIAVKSKTTLGNSSINNLILSYLIFSYLILSYLILSYLILSYLILSYLATISFIHPSTPLSYFLNEMQHCYH